MKKTITSFAALSALFCASQSQAVDLGIMTDITYSSSTKDGATGGFVLGQFDVFGAQQIGEKDRAFAEFVIEDSDGFKIDLERMWIEHTFANSFKLAAGRFHTPLGYYNRTYHHGSLLQFSVYRPAFLEFEDSSTSILPVHIVGLLASGNLPLSLSYELAVANGGSINTSVPEANREIEMNNVGDPNNSKATVLRILAAPPSTPFQVGVFGMKNAIAESGDASAASGLTHGSTLIDQNIYGLDFKYESNWVRMLGEGFAFSNDSKVPGRTGKYSALAYYVQLEIFAARKWTPGYRYESVSFDKNDPYFNFLLSREEETHQVIGLRYDVDDTNAIKLQADIRHPDTGDADTTYSLQWTWIMP